MSIEAMLGRSVFKLVMVVLVVVVVVVVVVVDPVEPGVDLSETDWPVAARSRRNMSELSPEMGNAPTARCAPMFNAGPDRLLGFVGWEDAPMGWFGVPWRIVTIKIAATKRPSAVQITASRRIPERINRSRRRLVAGNAGARRVARSQIVSRSPLSSLRHRFPIYIPVASWNKRDRRDVEYSVRKRAAEDMASAV